MAALYRAVFLLHLSPRGPSYPYAAVAVMAGREAEVPKLRPLVDSFVAAVGQGVMKTLIFDRGFLDGAVISHLKTDLGVNCVLPLKAGMLDLEDARVLSKVDGEPWETWHPPPPPTPVEPPERPEVVRRREKARQRTVEEQRLAKALPPPVRVERVDMKRVRELRLWETTTVPIDVVLLKEYRSDGEVSEWSLATTKTGGTGAEVRETYALRTAIEERHRQLKCFWDLTRFRSRALSLVTAQVVFVLLAYSLLQVFLAKADRGEENPKTRERLLGELKYQDDMLVLYSKNRVAYLTPLAYQEALLGLSEGARRRVLARTKMLRERLLLGTELPRRPGI